jgi:hypothetical protein
MEIIMSKLPVLPLYAYTVHWTGLDGLTQKAAITASYFQESGVYTVFKDTDHSVVEAFKTECVTRIVRTEKPVVDVA